MMVNTLPQSLIHAYLRARESGVPAHAALSLARLRYYRPRIVFDDNGVAKTTRGIYNITIRKEIDDFCDLDLGKFTDAFSEGAIPHDSGNPRTFNYFVPKVSESEHFEALKNLYSRAEARRLAREAVLHDYHRAASYGETWGYMSLCVSVAFSGVVLAYECLGGIEDDANDSYLDPVIDNLISDAVNEAKKTLFSVRR